MTRLRRHARSFVFALALVAVAGASPARAAAPADSTPPPAREALRREARALLPLVRHAGARAFVEAAWRLPEIAPRTIWFDSARTRFWTAPAAAQLPDSARARLISRTLDERFYYYTRYGTPLAYARALDLVEGQGLHHLGRRRIADFGYGTIGHLRLLASLGADVVGIDVDPLLRTLYADPGDTGAIAPEGGGRAGGITLVEGKFPADPAVVAAVGDGYDLFLSKNTLKRGYIHPSERADPRQLVHLEVSDSVFVVAVHRALAPGGFAMIYNLSPAPAPAGQPYRPWADGHDPFAREVWERAGFEVLVYDAEDHEAARRMAHALGWDAGPNPMDLEQDLFARYSIYRKR
jgi:hypothetical protein